MRSILRRITPRRLRQIDPPDVVDVGGALMSAPQVEAVRLEPLEKPPHSSVPLIRQTKLMEFVNWLAESKPEIESVFEPFAQPEVDGRRYTGAPSRSRPRHSSVRTRNGHPSTGGMSPHREGVDVDVFERLRFILQPPILPRAGRPAMYPNGLKPYPFQVTGVRWLVEHQQGLLADQMGLGKTIQAIIAMRVLFRRGSLQSALVVCPASMTNVWAREISLWAPELRTLSVQGPPYERPTKWRSHSEIHIVSYETLRNDIKGLDGDRFDLYVLDEAQKIKNPQTKVHRSIRWLSPKYRWALTGTPIENVVEDVVSIFDVLVPSLFAGQYSPRAHEVRQTIRPHVLRRTIDEVQLELPELTHQDHWLDLHPRQRSTYRAVEQEGIAVIKEMGGRATRMNILGLITVLKQICNYDDVSGQSCKLAFLIDELESLTMENDKALVFSQYPNKTLRKIAPKLRPFNPLIYDGSLSTSRRDEVVLNFQESDDNAVLLMSVRAGGLGITLTRANHVFHFDHWWNPATIDQASARVRRIGQRKPVFVHSLYATNTIEERIFTLLRTKREVFREVFGSRPDADDKSLTRLSDEDLFGLFDLEPPNEEDTDTQNSLRG